MMSKKNSIIILIIIFLLASFFRFYNLERIPPGLYPDEAANGNNALEALKTGNFKVFYQDNNGREGLFINLISYSIKYLGLKPISIRIISAIIGSLTIFGIYLLTKTLFLNECLSLLSSFFLAISFWHINFSRIGFRGILVPFFLTFSFYFLWQGLKKNDFFKITIAGFIFSLGFYSYIAYRFAVLLLVLVFLIDLLKRQKSQKNNLFWQKWFFLFLVIFIFSLPLLNYFYHHPEDFASRTKQVSVFSDKHPFLSFLKSLTTSLLMFNFKGDGNWRHNLAGQPELFFFQGFLFLLGIFLALKKIKRPEMVFILSWLIIMILPAALTKEGLPHALRSIGAIPSVYILVALGGEFLWQESKKFLSPKKRNIFFASLLLLLTLISFYRYFFVWANKQEVKEAFNLNYLLEGQHLNSLPKEIPKYVICWAKGVPFQERGEKRFLPMNCQTIMFISNTFLPEGRKEKNVYYLLPEETKDIFKKEKKVIISIR